MKKIFSLLALTILLNGCVESMALLGPASSVVGGGNVIQSAASSAVSYGVKKQTGKSPSEHAVAYVQKNNPQKKKEKCIEILESTNSETCAALKKNINETTKKIVKAKNSIFNKSKIEDLAKKSGIVRR